MSEIERKIYKVEVNYGEIVDNLVPLKSYDTIIVSRRTIIEVEVETICFNLRLELKEVSHQLDEIGFRFGNLEEFLAFGAQYPKVQCTFPIVTYINNLLFTLSFCGVPDSWSSSGWRELTVDKLKDNSHSFHGNVRFLAVKK